MVRYGNTYPCKLFKKLKNRPDYEKEAKEFYCRILDDKEMDKIIRTNGLITPNTRLVIQTMSFVEDIDSGDRVELLGKVYIVESATIEYTKARRLGQGRMSTNYINSNAPKTIALK